MTPIEIQELNNKKDWNSLAGIEWLDFNSFLTHEGARVTREFVLEFLCSRLGNRLLTLFNYRLVALIDESGLEFSKSEYKKILNTPEANFDLIYLLNLTPRKSQDFLEFYLDNFHEISKVNYPTSFSITQNILGDGSLNERLAELINDSWLFSRVINNVKIHVDEAGISFFEEYINTESKLKLLTAKQPVDNKLLKTLISSMSEDDVMRFISQHAHNIRNLQPIMDSLGNINYTINDENISTLLQNNSEPMLRIMTKDQVIKFRSKFTSDDIANSNKLSLDEFVGLYPNARLSSIPYGFHTEEEIAKYPQLFNPKSYGIHGLYYTKETLRILNKFWGTRQRYSPGESDNPTYILIRCPQYLIPEIIRYLESKGSIDWPRVLKNLHAAHMTPFNPKLTIVEGFLSKYKDQ